MAIEQRATRPVTIEELQRRIDAAKDGEIIMVAAGTVRGCLVIDKPLTLRGEGPDVTVLDGAGLGPTISIDSDRGEVRIEAMSITGGRGPFGGGVSIDNGGTVHISGCLFDRNVARSGRGGAIAIDVGTLHVSECTLVENQAFQGGAIFAGGDARVVVSASVIGANGSIQGGAITATEGAEVEVWTSRFDQNRAEDRGQHLFMYGTRTRQPRLVLSNSIVGAADGMGLPIFNHPRFKGDLVVDNSMVDRTKPNTFFVG